MPFQVIPAIDLRGGRCVRLYQGDYERETRYAGDPVEVAERWTEMGAPMIHVVDLDGARYGKPANYETIRSICAAIPIPVEVSGGLRSLADIRSALEGGAERVQLGSIAVRNPDLVRTATTEFPGRIVVSIDAKNGQVMTDGWQKGSGRSAIEFAESMVALGVPRIMFTDILRDGALEGPNVDAFQAMIEAVDVPVVASGGITATSHIAKLAEAGCEGAIVGRALYEGVLDLAEALEVAAKC